MFLKKRVGFIKLRINPGKANPSPPVGPSLGQKGLNIMNFCKLFNNSTININNSFLIPVVVDYYSDKSFDLIIKKPTINYFLNKISNFDLNNISFFNIYELIKFKMDDFNTFNFYSSFKIVLGVIKSMKIKYILNDYYK
ncbi:MAG: 50S ribosomal protein L11 [Candidatus Nasuia deltocephalinicola]